MARIFLLVAALCFGVPPSALAGSAAVDEPVARHFARLRAELDPRARAALERIDGLDRQLLAARAYLRAGTALDQRWSWTQSQIAAWQGSPAQRALDADVDAVRRAFERRNPGYSLFVNPQVRSLDLQLQRWNATTSITQAGARLAATLRAAVGRSDFPPPGTPEAATAFQALLRDHAPLPVPTLAAPGLSAHGRMSAVDFQVRQGRRIVAGPDSRSVGPVWNAQGWGPRLQAAVREAGAPFQGPLLAPAEPWHYDYRP